MYEPETPTIPAPVEPIAVNHHAEAGRRGAHRVHQLIRLGKLYEQEHGLKRGRQRLRQLIEEGKLYEQEHGLRSRPRVPRVGREQALRDFLRALQRIVQPAYRAELAALVENLDAHPVVLPESAN
jgi:hypothetical protein